MSPREEFLVQFAYMIDDLANLAADLGCDPDELTKIERGAEQALGQLWEAAS